MRTFKFKNRLFLAYAAVTTGIVVLFAFVLIGFTSSLNRETELMHQQEVFEGNLQQLETLLMQADRLAAQVASNNEILNVFISLDDPARTQGGGENYFDDQLMDTIRLGSLLSGMNGVDGFADRISVFNRYDDYVSTGRLYETPENIAATLADIPRIDAITRDIQGRPLSFLIAGFHPDDWSNNPNASFLSLYRILSYTDTSAPYGLVSVQLHADRFRSLDFWANGSQPTYFLLDVLQPEAPALVYPEEMALPAGTVLAAVAPELEETRAQGKRVACFPYAWEGQDVMLLASSVYDSNWLLVRTLPVGTLASPYTNSYLIMGLGCLALLLLMLVLVNYMAERISRPLRTLSASIGGVGLQNLRLNADGPRTENSTEELKALDEAFRTMLSRLETSIALEMQAYMRVLQAQMNPHFLYNMLSVIIASSEQAGDKRTVSMCLKLTAMLRYIADAQREHVTMRDELEHTRNYLELMQERYEDLFSFTIEAEPEALDVEMPKLTVQPLAENCFMHGFETEPPWHIHIVAGLSEGRWSLCVEDNGVGMSEQEISALTERMEVYRRDVAGNYQELTLGGMGLVNTLLRLSLMRDDPVWYTITNRPEGGLRIEIGGIS